MHVRISKVGRKILNDRKLSSKVAYAIINGREQLITGNAIKVIDEGMVIGDIKLVTAIK